MLDRYYDSMLPLAAFDFPPQIRFASLIPNTISVAFSDMKAKHWGAGATTSLVRDTDKQYLFGVDFRRVFCQSATLKTWKEKLSMTSSLMSKSVKGMEAEKIVRGGFKIWCFMKLDMSHEEMVDLLYGSFLPQSKEIEEICSEPIDGLAQIHGVYKGFRHQVVISPMKDDQARATINSFDFLDKFYDPVSAPYDLENMKRRLASTCLFLDVDVSKENLASEEIDRFIVDSLNTAESLIEKVLARFRSLTH